MDTITCPGCGSPQTEKLAYPEYRCPYCGTVFTPAKPASGFVDLILTQNPQGKNQIEVIKKLREVTDLDLTKAKWVTENLPAVILQNLKAEEGERIKAALEKAGAAVSIKPT